MSVIESLLMQLFIFIKKEMEAKNLLDQSHNSTENILQII